MRYLKGFYLSLGMFCAIPLPTHLWSDPYMNLAMPCFPLVGALTGALWWGLAELLVMSGAPVVLAAALLAVTPFFLTGLLHLDGFMDTSDAILSRRPLEDKLRILKDPHAGSFAVIMIAVLFLLQFAAVYAIVERGHDLILLIIISVLSRCAAALSILCLKTIAQSSYANAFKQNTGATHKAFILFLTVCATMLAFLSAGVAGLIVPAAVILGYSGAAAYTVKDLGGISGDLAGFSIVTGELCGLIALALL